MTYHWYQSLVIVGTNKERIEQLEDGLRWMELGMADIGCGIWKKLLTVSLMYCMQTRSL